MVVYVLKALGDKYYNDDKGYCIPKYRDTCNTMTDSSVEVFRNVMEFRTPGISLSSFSKRFR